MTSLAAMDFSEADRNFRYTKDYHSSIVTLESMLSQVSSNEERCEVRIPTSLLLSQLLDKRGWSAQKRKAVSSQNATLYLKAKKNIEKFSFMDGSDTSVEQMSDEEESVAVIASAKARYEKEYKELLKYQN